MYVYAHTHVSQHEALQTGRHCSDKPTASLRPREKQRSQEKWEIIRKE